MYLCSDRNVSFGLIRFRKFIPSGGSRIRNHGRIRMNIVSLTRVKDQFDEISLVSTFLFLPCTYTLNKRRCDSYCSFAGIKICTFTINPKLRNRYLPMPVCHIRTGTNEKFSMIFSFERRRMVMGTLMLVSATRGQHVPLGFSAL